MFKTIAITTLARISGAAFTLLLTIVIARKLSLADAGRFFLTFTIANVLTIFYLFGTQTAALKYIGASHASGRSGELKGISILSFLMICAWGGIITVTIWFSAPLFVPYVWPDDSAIDVVRTAALAAYFLAGSTLSAHCIQATRKTISSTIILYSLLPMFIATSILMGNINTFTGLQPAFVVSAAMCFAIGLGYWIWMLPNGNSCNIDSRGFVKTCLPLWSVSLLHIVTLLGTQIIASIWVDAEQIALMSVALRITAVLGLVGYACEIYVAPLFSALSEDGKTDSIRRVIQICVVVLFVITLPVFLGLLLFSDFVLGLFGEEFKQARIVLFIFMAGQWVNIITGPVSYILAMCGYEYDLQRLIFVCTLGTIILAILLTPRLGIIGAAMGSAIGIAAQNILCVFLVRRKMGFNIFSVSDLMLLRLRLDSRGSDAY